MLWDIIRESNFCSTNDIRRVMTWLTITECHSWPWTFSVVKIMSSFLCLCQVRSVQSHNYIWWGYLFYLLVRGWFWILCQVMVATRWGNNIHSRRNLQTTNICVGITHYSMNAGNTMSTNVKVSNYIHCS
jgi:hypothetical protein